MHTPMMWREAEEIANEIVKPQERGRQTWNRDRKIIRAYLRGFDKKVIQKTFDITPRRLNDIIALHKADLIRRKLHNKHLTYRK